MTTKMKSTEPASDPIHCAATMDLIEELRRRGVLPQNKPEQPAPKKWAVIICDAANQEYWNGVVSRAQDRGILEAES